MSYRDSILLEVVHCIQHTTRSAVKHHAAYTPSSLHHRHNGLRLSHDADI